MSFARAFDATTFRPLTRHVAQPLRPPESFTVTHQPFDAGLSPNATAFTLHFSSARATCARTSLRAASRLIAPGGVPALPIATTFVSDAAVTATSLPAGTVTVLSPAFAGSTSTDPRVT